MNLENFRAFCISIRQLVFTNTNPTARAIIQNGKFLCCMFYAIIIFAKIIFLVLWTLQRGLGKEANFRDEFQLRMLKNVVKDKISKIKILHWWSFNMANVCDAFFMRWQFFANTWCRPLDAGTIHNENFFVMHFTCAWMVWQQTVRKKLQNEIKTPRKKWRTKGIKQKMFLFFELN